MTKEILLQCYTYYCSENLTTISIECEADYNGHNIIELLLAKLDIDSNPLKYLLVEIDTTQIDRDLGDLNISENDNEADCFVSVFDLKSLGKKINYDTNLFSEPKDYFINSDALNINKAKHIKLFLIDKATYESTNAMPEAKNDRSSDFNVDDWLKPSESDNLVKLPALNEQILLEKLEERYHKNKIFTYVDNILIFVNPFVYMSLYNPKVFSRYNNHTLGYLSPHIYAIADDAYQGLINSNKNQCVVICGESGSGKTECTRFIIQHLTYISSKTKYSINNFCLLSSIEVLEAFGNASTISNNNSSRFGKLTQLLYSSTGSISGVILKSYLLEKSRIVKQSPNEKNYHIFYYLLNGMNQSEQESLFINSNTHYNFLSNIFTTDNKDSYVQKLAGLKKAMSGCGIDVYFQNNIFNVVASILLLGNFLIGKNDSNNSIINDFSFNAVLKLLEIDEKRFVKTLISKSTVMRSERITVYLNEEQISGHIYTLSKTLYSRLFQWMVIKINNVLHPTTPNQDSNVINVLDIFGFENFNENYFEQFCINYANENLQYFFNLHTFKLCQDEYKNENITWNTISYTDNQTILTLFHGRPNGLISLIEEECLLAVGTDLGMVSKFAKTHDKHPLFWVSPLKPSHFTVSHYAGKVEYDVTGFRERNLEKYSHELIEVLRKSENSFIRNLITFDSKSSIRWLMIKFCFLLLLINNKFKKNNFDKIKSSLNAIQQQSSNQPLQRNFNDNKRCYMSIVTQFSESLNELLQILGSCNPYFVRCIHSNKNQQPMVFDSKNVMKQLLNTGVIHSIQIRQMGYKYRYNLQAFIDQFQIVLPHNHIDLNSIKSYLGSIFAEDDFKIGQTKIFIKQNIYDHLNNLLYMTLRNNLSNLENWFYTISIRLCVMRNHLVTNVSLRSSSTSELDFSNDSNLSNQISITNDEQIDSNSSNYQFKRSHVIYLKPKRPDKNNEETNDSSSQPTDAQRPKLKPQISITSITSKSSITRSTPLTRTNYSNSTVCRPHSSSDVIIHSISELYLFYQFIVEKIKINDNPQDQSKSLSSIDIKFSEALKNFSVEILARFLTLQQTNEKVELTFDHIFFKFSNFLKKLSSSKSSKKIDDSFVIVLNAFSGMLYEFKNNYMTNSQPKKIKLFHDKTTFNYKLHSIKSTDVNDHTFCDYCALSITDKAFRCLDCNTIVHKNCLSLIKNQCVTSGTTFFSLNRKKFFGVSLNCLPCNNNKIPLKLLALLQEIELRGLTTEGIYRKSPNEKVTKKLKNDLETIDTLDIRTIAIHSIAAAVKHFYRSLPTPLIPNCHIDFLIKSDDLIIERIEDMLNKLPLFNRRVFDRLIHHLSMVELYSNVNLMNASNLSVIFTPCILHNDLSTMSDIEKMKKRYILLETCINNQSSIFRNTINQFNNSYSNN